MNKKVILLLLILLVGGIMIWYRYRQPRFVAGESAPDFEVALRTGEKARLSDLQGKYVLLQFWGSWCGPCRRENPQLVELYDKYHDRNFEIFSIGLEGNPAAWERAIQQDGLPWKYHAAEFQGFDGEVARLFNIKSIPATFLINPDRQIIGVNLDPDQIEQRLSKALTN